MRDVLPGMRAAMNGAVALDGLALPNAALFGASGAYLRESLLSGGALRTSPVAFGALDASIEAACELLLRRGQDAHLPQRARWVKLLSCIKRLSIGRPAPRCRARMRPGREAVLASAQHQPSGPPSSRNAPASFQTWSARIDRVPQNVE